MTRGAERFAQQVPNAQRSVVQSVLAALALLALVIGVPALLLVFTGAPPVPTSLPDAAALSRPISTEQVLTVLIAVVWLAWLHFAVCTLVEVAAAVRGGTLAPRVPLGGGSQRLARALVAALLLSTGVGTSVAGAAAALPPSSAGVVATASGTQSHAPTAGSSSAASPTASPAASSAAPTPASSWGQMDGAGHEPPGRAMEREGPVQEAAWRADAEPGVLDWAEDYESALWGKKVYLVQPPEGRHHDSLWDIAERHLGDGRRYREIYQLNADREQPDGRTLQLARLIHPGWQLVMPEDAVGVARWEVPVVPSGVAGDGSGAVAGGPSGDGSADDADRSDESGGPAGSGLGGATGGHDDGGLVDPLTGVAGLAGAGLLAAGLLAALRRQRARGRHRVAPAGANAVEAEVWLRVGADAARSQRLDAALRSLPDICAQAGRPVPQAYAAGVDDESVQLHLAPAAPEAPAPWSVQQDGGRWTLDVDAATTAPAQASPAAFPALVSLGRNSLGRDVLADVSAAAGLIAVGGGPVQAAEVLRALAVELATNPWSRELRVLGVDLPAALGTVTGGRMRVAATVEDAIGLAGGTAPIGDGVVSGRRLPARRDVAVIILGRRPTDAEADLLARSAAAAGGSLGVLVAGEVPGATWQLQVDDAGSLRVPALEVTLTANRIGDATMSALAELFAAATPAPGSGSGASAGSPGAAARTAGAAADRPPVPAPVRTADDGAWAVADARVGLMGSLLVRAPGPIDPSRIDRAAELVAVLATAPEGVHPNVLAAAVWPRGVSGEVRAATVERVRDWLGTDAQGGYRLREAPGGRLVLGPDVLSDWQVFCTLAGRARAAASPAQERDLLARALRLARGAVVAGAPQGRFGWLARTGLEDTVPRLVADTAHRLVELVLDDDPAAATEAARLGLRVAPTLQPLWRDVLNAESRLWGGDGVRSVVGELQGVLRAAGLDLEPETEALVEELLPTLPHLPVGGVAAG